MKRTDEIAVRLERARASIAHGLAVLAELETVAADEVAAVVAMVVHHLRSRYPEAVAPRGACWPSRGPGGEP